MSKTSGFECILKFSQIALYDLLRNVDRIKTQSPGTNFGGILWHQSFWAIEVDQLILESWDVVKLVPSNYTAKKSLERMDMEVLTWSNITFDHWLLQIHEIMTALGPTRITVNHQLLRAWDLLLTSFFGLGSRVQPRWVRRNRFKCGRTHCMMQQKDASCQCAYWCS